MADGFIVQQRLKFSLILTIVLFVLSLFAAWYFHSELSYAVDERSWKMALAVSFGLGVTVCLLLVLYLFSRRVVDGSRLTDWVDAVPWSRLGALFLLPVVGAAIWIGLEYAVPKQNPFELLRKGKQAALEAGIQDNPQWLQQQNENGDTLLQAAYRANAPEMTGMLLHLGVPKEELQAVSADPVKASLTDTSMLAVLLEAGLDPDQPDAAGWSPLHHAVLLRRSDAAEALLEAGAVVDRRDPLSRTPLMLAVEGGHPEIARLLLKQGARPDLFDQKGETALYKAVRRREVETVGLLLEEGADPSILDLAGEAPVHQAARNGQLDLLTLFAAVPGQVEQPDEKGRRPLAYALDEWQFDAAELLLQQGADLNYVGRDGATLLHNHLRARDYRSVRFLIDQGARTDIPDASGVTAMALIRRKELQGLIDMIELQD